MRDRSAWRERAGFRAYHADLHDGRLIGSRNAHERRGQRRRAGIFQQLASLHIDPPSLVFCVIVGCCPRFFLLFRARTIAFFAERKNISRPRSLGRSDRL
jgi:hypothetical protein